MDEPWRARIEHCPPAAALLGRRLVGVDREQRTAHFAFFAPPNFANRHGTVQGGLLSAMLDSAAATALLATLPLERTAVTMSLTTSFVKPAPLGALTATAQVVEIDERAAEVHAELMAASGEVVATAIARLRIRAAS